jgi:hypothetical protein
MALWLDGRMDRHTDGFITNSSKDMHTFSTPIMWWEKIPLSHKTMPAILIPRCKIQVLPTADCGNESRWQRFPEVHNSDISMYPILSSKLSPTGYHIPHVRTSECLDFAFHHHIDMNQCTPGWTYCSVHSVCLPCHLWTTTIIKPRQMQNSYEVWLTHKCFKQSSWLWVWPVK